MPLHCGKQPAIGVGVNRLARKLCALFVQQNQLRTSKQAEAGLRPDQLEKPRALLGILNRNRNRLFLCEAFVVLRQCQAPLRLGLHPHEQILSHRDKIPRRHAAAEQPRAARCVCAERIQIVRAFCKRQLFGFAARVLLPEYRSFLCRTARQNGIPRRCQRRRQLQVSRQRQTCIFQMSRLSVFRFLCGFPVGFRRSFLVGRSCLLPARHAKRCHLFFPRTAAEHGKQQNQSAEALHHSFQAVFSGSCLPERRRARGARVSGCLCNFAAGTSFLVCTIAIVYAQTITLVQSCQPLFTISDDYDSLVSNTSEVTR